MDPNKGLIIRDGQSHRLQSLQMRVLCFLCRNADRDVDRDELALAVWGVTHVSEQSVQNAVSAIRRGLNDSHLSPSYIATSRNRGYRIIAPIEAIESAQPDTIFAFFTRHWRLLVVAFVALVATLGWSLRDGSGWSELARFLQGNPGQWEVIVSDEEPTDS